MTSSKGTLMGVKPPVDWKSIVTAATNNSLVLIAAVGWAGYQFYQIDQIQNQSLATIQATQVEAIALLAKYDSNLGEIHLRLEETETDLSTFLTADQVAAVANGVYRRADRLQVLGDKVRELARLAGNYERQVEAGTEGAVDNLNAVLREIQVYEDERDMMIRPY